MNARTAAVWSLETAELARQMVEVYISFELAVARYVGLRAGGTLEDQLDPIRRNVEAASNEWGNLRTKLVSRIQNELAAP